MNTQKKTSWDQFTENSLFGFLALLAVALFIVFPPSVIALAILAIAIGIVRALAKRSAKGKPSARLNPDGTWTLKDADGVPYMIALTEDEAMQELTRATDEHEKRKGK